MIPAQADRKTWTILSLLSWTSDYFHKKGIEQPRLNAELLLAHTLNCKRIDLYLDFEKPLQPEERSRFKALVRRRAAREPLQYIIGKCDFWSLSLKVDQRVLIPRPETEILVESAVRWIRGNGAGTDTDKTDKKLRILDLGTGSGAIALALLKEVPKASVVAADISKDALEVAWENAQSLGLLDRITFCEGNLFEALDRSNLQSFDCIVSNPPYIASSDFPSLEPEIRLFEPRIALLAGKEGLDVIRKIVADAPSWLAPGGKFFIEIGAGQSQAVKATVEQMSILENFHIIPDYAGIPRVLSAQRGR